MSDEEKRRAVPWLTLLETAFLLLGLVGVAMVYVPGAVILGAVLGVWACERAAADKKRAAVVRRGDGAGGERQ
ncbi:hypothetical protein ACIP9H_40470 [Streptomyces sp. NPDC088732]|uniref:hypothetical protein n=1 Tax=Streptomyces sp. NPDC088732 TaxID=3365879 RepID=UPI0037F1F3AE